MEIETTKEVLIDNNEAAVEVNKQYLEEIKDIKDSNEHEQNESLHGDEQYVVSSYCKEAFHGESVEFNYFSRNDYGGQVKIKKYEYLDGSVFS